MGLVPILATRGHHYGLKWKQQAKICSRVPFSVEYHRSTQNIPFLVKSFYIGNVKRMF